LEETSFKGKLLNRKKFWISCIIGSFGLFILSLVLYAEIKLSKLVLGGLGESFSTKVFSSPFVIHHESIHSYEQLLLRLKRLQYREVREPPSNPGEFYPDSPHLWVWLRGFKVPSYAQDPLEVHLRIRGDSVCEVRNTEKEELNDVALEPELVAELSGPKKIRRVPAKWEEFPVALMNAVVATEDHKFFQHWGIRPLSIGRAFLHNIRSDSSQQGGSTITQQLAKNLFLTPKRTFRRKGLEAFLAIYLEIRYKKEDILTLYLNHIYLGQDGFLSIAGMKAAADYYFAKEFKDLTLEESALLAGLIRSPHRYNPYLHPEEALQRRNFVLFRMHKEKLLAEEEMRAAQLAQLQLVTHHAKGLQRNPFDFYVAEIMRQLTPLYGEDALHRYGLQIYTEMDTVIQTKAHAAVQMSPDQAAVVAMEPNTGRVLALVGGKDFRQSQFNRATQAKRQPGSAFKAFVFGAALEKGISLSTFLNDTRRTFKGKDGKPWTPKNYNDVYNGTATVRMAFTHSLNAATIDLAEKIGIESVKDFATKLGFETPTEVSLALALGTSETTLLDLTKAYAPFANGGFQVQPVIINSVVDSEHNLIQIDTVQRKSVLDPTVAYLMTSLMESVVNEGTARYLKDWGWTYPTAGKTGTTNGGKDAWFIGYTPRLLAGVWVGNDEAKAISAAGAKDALPIWAKLMNGLKDEFPPLPFTKPEGLIEVRIDPLSGQLAQSGCPNRIDEMYLIGTEPKNKCPLHRGGLKGWFRKIFEKIQN